MACEHDPRLLFRIEESEQGTQILVQSQGEPDWETAFADLPVLTSHEHKVYEPSFSAGQVLAFRLRANPTRKLSHKGADGKQGKRVGLYREDEQRAWLARKATAGGFEVLGVQLRDEGKLKSSIRRAGEEAWKLEMLAVRFDGLLRVTDVERFGAALRAGIGSGKGLGFGLLSIALPV
jgi:CRISPR system Cascade subunit CasE